MKNINKVFFALLLLVVIVGITIFTYNPFKKNGETKIENIDGQLYQVQDYAPNWGQKGFRATSTSTSTDQYSEWKTYSDEKYGINFKYPKEWGDVLPHDEGDGMYVFRIATDNNKTSNCVPVLGPDCKTSPDVLIAIRKGEGFNQFVSETESRKQTDSVKKIVGGITAVSYTFVLPIDTPSIGPRLGYNKVVLVGLQKSDKTFIEVAFTSPTKYKQGDAQAYNTSDFENFLSTVVFTSI